MKPILFIRMNRNKPKPKKRTENKSKNSIIISDGTFWKFESRFGFPFFSSRNRGFGFQKLKNNNNMMDKGVTLEVVFFVEN